MLIPQSLAFLIVAAGDTGGFGIEPVYIAWQFGSYTLLAVVLYFFGIKPILKTMDERNTRIESGLRNAEEMKQKLVEADNRFEARLNAAADEAAKIAREAADRAKIFEEKAAKDAGAKVEDILRRADDQLKREREQMLLELRAEVARLVVETAGKVLSKELSAEEKSRFNSAAAGEIASKN